MPETILLDPLILPLRPSLHLALDSFTGLTDLSGNGYTATAQGGLTVGGSDAFVNGATDFDGSNDYISTSYGTRRNLVTNPSFEVDTAGWTTGLLHAGASTLTRTSAQSYRGSNSLKVDTSGSVNSGVEVASGLTATAGQQVTVTIALRGGSGGESVQLVLSDSASGGQTTSTKTLTTGWQVFSITATLPNGAIRFAVRVPSATALTFYLDAVLIEQAAATAAYFDGSGYDDANGNFVSANGTVVGWLGTAHASASDKGVFANGTVRTFMGLASRDATGTFDALIAGDQAAAPRVYFIDTDNSLTFDPGQGGAVASWSAAETGVVTGQPFFWTFVFNEPGNTVTLYINGASRGAKSLATQYDSGSSLKIGAANTGSSLPFDGKQQHAIVVEGEVSAGDIGTISRLLLGQRAQLNVNSGAIQVRQEGVDWGNAEIQAYQAEQARGSSPVDFRIPNRQIQVPLMLQTSGTVTFAQARSKLAAKVARIQQEGGALKRVTSQGGTLYADIVNAALSYSGGWMQAHKDTDVEALLTLEAIPDFYGAEVALTDHTETSAAELVFTETGIDGDYPGRVRLVVDDDQAQNQRGMIWSFRSRHYSSASTAAVRYEAEALQALDTAAAAAKVGASGGTVVTHGTLSTSWTPVVGTNIGGTGYLTHTGTNRIFARVFSTSGTTVQSRFVWDVGDLVYPVENNAVRLYDGGTFHILDLGEVRLDPTPSGAHRWQGQIQAKGDVGGENFSVDRLWIVNADEGMGVLRAPLNVVEGQTTYSGRDEFSQSAGAISGKTATVGGNWSASGQTISINATDHVAERTGSTGSAGDAYLGSVSLTDQVVRADVKFSSVSATGSVVDRAGVRARRVDGSNTVTAWLQRNGQLYLEKFISASGTTLATRSYTVGADNWYTIQLAIIGNQIAVWVAPRGANLGSPLIIVSDTTVGALASGSPGIYTADDASTSTTRQIDNFAVWVPTNDAVVYASRSAELSTQGITRQDTGGTAYGPVSYVSGDIPRIPPAGLEGRTTEVFIKPSRGDIQTLTDPAIDDGSARVFYRPSYLLVPES